jgi:hypothetical protein
LVGGILVGAGILIGTHLQGPAPVASAPGASVPARATVSPAPRFLVVPSAPVAGEAGGGAVVTAGSGAFPPDVRAAIERRFGKLASVEGGWGGPLPPSPGAERAQAEAKRLADEGQLQQAERVLRDGIGEEADPRHAEILRFRLLEVLKRRGERSEARALLEEIGRTSTRMDTQAAVLEALDTAKAKGDL